MGPLLMDEDTCNEITKHAELMGFSHKIVGDGGEGRIVLAIALVNLLNGILNLPLPQVSPWPDRCDKCPFRNENSQSNNHNGYLYSRM